MTDSETRCSEHRLVVSRVQLLLAVGATGCANGMWAYKEESKDGYYSPEGGCLYRSFTPAYTDWDIRDDNGTWLHNSDNKDKHTLKDIMKILAK